jgi:hypothetical protein
MIQWEEPVLSSPPEFEGSNGRTINLGCIINNHDDRYNLTDDDNDREQKENALEREEQH